MARNVSSANAANSEKNLTMRYRRNICTEPNVNQCLRYQKYLPCLSSSSASSLTSPSSTARLIVLKIFSAAKYLPWRRRRSYYAKEPVINLFVNGDEEHIAALLGDVIGCVTLAANCWGPVIPSNPKRPQLDSSKKPRRYSEKPGSFGQFRSTMTYNGDGRWERRDSWGHQSVARPDPIPKRGNRGQQRGASQSSSTAGR